MSYETPALVQAREVLAAEFGDIIVGFGVYNRRKISGSTTWSQHSWPNALDVHVATLANGDKLFKFLKDNWEALNIKVLLWRVRNHYDHLHIDFWPSGYGTPSLTRGGDDNRFRYPDGSIKDEAVLLNEYELEEDVLKKGDSGPRVVKVQEQLLEIGYQLPEYGADGDFGDETVAAVVAFQTDRELEPDGVLRAVDTSILFRITLQMHKDKWARQEASRAHERLDGITVPE